MQNSKEHTGSCFKYSTTEFSIYCVITFRQEPQHHSFTSNILLNIFHPSVIYRPIQRTFCCHIPLWATIIHITFWRTFILWKLKSLQFHAISPVAILSFSSLLISYALICFDIVFTLLFLYIVFNLFSNFI